MQEAGGGGFEKATGLMGEKRYLDDLLLLGLSLVHTAGFQMEPGIVDGNHKV